MLDSINEIRNKWLINKGKFLQFDFANPPSSSFESSLMLWNNGSWKTTILEFLYATVLVLKELSNVQKGNYQQSELPESWRWLLDYFDHKLEPTSEINLNFWGQNISLRMDMNEWREKNLFVNNESIPYRTFEEDIPSLQGLLQSYWVKKYSYDNNSFTAIRSEWRDQENQNIKFPLIQNISNPIIVTDQLSDDYSVYSTDDNHVDLSSSVLNYNIFDDGVEKLHEQLVSFLKQEWHKSVKKIEKILIKFNFEAELIKDYMDKGGSVLESFRKHFRECSSLERLIHFIFLFDVHKHKLSFSLHFENSIFSKMLPEARWYRDKYLDVLIERIREIDPNEIIDHLRASWVNLTLSKETNRTLKIRKQKNAMDSSAVIDFLLSNEWTEFLENFVTEYLDALSKDRNESVNIQDVLNSKTLCKAYELNFFSFEPIFSINGELIPYRNLSSWERKVIKIICELFYKIVPNNENLILIEEIENSLNPWWQEKIMSTLEDMANGLIRIHSKWTRIQVIYTTHSIIIPTSFKSTKILYLKSDDNHNGNIHSPISFETLGCTYEECMELYELNSISGKSWDNYLRRLIEFLRKQWMDIGKSTEDNRKHTIKEKVFSKFVSRIRRDFQKQFGNDEILQTLAYLYVIENDSILYFVLRSHISMLFEIIRPYRDEFKNTKILIPRNIRNFSESRLLNLKTIFYVE